MSKDNMELWNKVCKTNPADTKKVTFGRGFTAIDPHSQIKRATEVLGVAGGKWGWEVIKIVPLDEIKEIGVLVRLTHGALCVEQFGQAGLFIDKNNSKKDSDCLKKATTDGLTKCLSYLGFNADVFEGKFDDNKYVAQMNAEFEGQKKDKMNEAVSFILTHLAENDAKKISDILDHYKSEKKTIWAMFTKVQQAGITKLLKGE